MKAEADILGTERSLRTEADASMAFPGSLWEEVSPETQNVHSGRLEKALSYLARKTGKDGVSEVVVIRNGRLIWRGDRSAVRHSVWSCTKSFAGTVLGLLIDQGKCSLDSLAKDYLPELAPGYPAVSLGHFTTMTSGYDGGGDQSEKPFTPTQPLFAPGTQFRYWDSAMNQFLHVLTRIAGEPAGDLFRRSIADPAGFDPDGWVWGNFGAIGGVLVNGGAGNKGKGIDISALEMARFGHLFLNHGCWAGRQLLSAKWVDLATAAQVPPSVPCSGKRSSDGPGRYGFNWWTNGPGRYGRRRWPSAPPGTYAAKGFNNNRCFVIPEWNMVFVRLGQDGNVNERVYDVFFKLLRKSVF
jgi:CubicO group peptidase (beta-lactamase class C family)